MLTGEKKCDTRTAMILVFFARNIRTSTTKWLDKSERMYISSLSDRSETGYSLAERWANLRVSLPTAGVVRSTRMIFMVLLSLFIRLSMES